MSAGSTAVSSKHLFGIHPYVLAALSVPTTLALQLAVNPAATLTIPLLLALLAVSLTAYFAGPGAALVVTAADLLLNAYLFSEPRFSFAVVNNGDRWRLTIFAAAGIGISLLSRRLSGYRHFARVALMLASSLLLVIGALLVWLDLESSRAAEAWVEHTYQVLSASQEWLSAIEIAAEQQRNYLLTRDQQQYIESYRNALAAERTARNKLRALTADNPPQQQRLVEVSRLADARLTRLKQAIAIRRENGPADVTEMLSARQDVRLMDDFRATLAAFEAGEYRLLNQRSQTAKKQAARTRWTLASGTVLVIALLIFAGLVIEGDILKLRSSERLLRRQADLLNRARGGIIVWSFGGKIEYWNQGAERIFGISRQQALGSDHDQLLHPFHPSGMDAIWQQLARDGEWVGELRHNIAGREVVVETHLTMVTEPDGHRTVLKTNRDITEEKRAHEEIQRLNRELEQRVKDRTVQLEATNKELEAFAYSVSHDLRAPLRGIDGWSLALLEDYGPTLDQTAHQYLERVRSETQRMGHLIDDLLKLSRLTRVELQRETVDLSSLARASADRLQEADSGHAVEFIIEDGLKTRGDSRLLDIVLSNLLSNAVKFSGSRALSRIEFGQAQANDCPAFFVRDNGVGFDMAHAGTLFGAFQRLHKYSEFPGSGIGLATAQRVIVRHGGRIWAEARLNEGATFYFTVGADSG